MNILALDLGTKCGWALSLDGQIVSGTWNLMAGRWDSAGMRFLKLIGKLDAVHGATPLDLIAYEEVRRHMSTDAAHAYGGYLAHVQAWADKQTPEPVNYTSFPVGTIKKHATGKGNADKAAMVAAARKRGWNPADDNEADALWILDLALTHD